MPAYAPPMAAVALALFGVANAHMVMNSPLPYDFPALQVGPIDKVANSQFPCGSGFKNSWDTIKSGGFAGTTKATAGSAVPVSFTGSAVHGGGSCQFSVTYEYPPPADPSKWKVIHTEIGGCPSTANGNLQPVASAKDANGRENNPTECTDNSQTECKKKYGVTIPTGLKNGQATFAWTWFNRMGNREMYMNCAPINIEGGSDNDDFYNSLPSVFVANAGTVNGKESCKITTLQGTLEIPDGYLGGSVNKAAGIDDGYAPDAACMAAFPPTGTAGAGAGDSPASPVVSSAPVSSPVGGNFAEGAPAAPIASAPAAAAPADPVVPTSKAAAPVVTSAPAAPPVTPVTSPAAGNASGAVACPTDGQVVCISATTFGLCDHGFAVPQALAAGTTCEGGKIVKRSNRRRHASVHARRMSNHV